MYRAITICVVLVCQTAPGLPKPSARLEELAGSWQVVGTSATSEQKVIPAELLGLTNKGTSVVIKGNELTSGGKLLATLTTDFTDSGLDFDKTVRFDRRPVLITLPSGRGLLCAYDTMHGGITLYYPHTIGRITQGTWLYFGKPEK